jgi:hypothetical protein
MVPRDLPRDLPPESAICQRGHRFGCTIDRQHDIATPPPLIRDPRSDRGGPENAAARSIPMRCAGFFPKIRKVQR